MLPATARANDLVEVIYEEHPNYGMIGKILKRDEHTANVDIFGKVIVFSHYALKIKARVGTSKYKELNESIEEGKTSNLTKDDYEDIINLAIDLKDFEWAADLIKRS